MAQVPTLSVPDVGASAVPVPTQRLTPPPEAFGATVASQALEGLGQVAEAHGKDLADYALQYQAINNKQAADAKSVGLNTQINNLLIDFQDKNQGVDPQSGLPRATTALPDLYKQMDTLRDQGRQDLSPLAQVEYDAASRRNIAFAQNTARTFAVAERRKAINNTAQASIEQAQSQMIAADPNDKVAQGVLASSIAGTMGYLGAQLGWSQEEGAANLQKALGKVYYAQMKVAVDGGNFPQAKELFAQRSAEMTPDQVEQAVALLKVSGNSYEANSVAQTVPVYGAPGAANKVMVSGTNQTPAGSWDSGLSAFRKDAPDTLRTLLGQPVTITSNARTAADNQRVGGAPTSEHLTGNAWDFVPANGATTANALTLAQNMHAAGIPFDQIEVDTSQGNAHIHVGFGPKNRNEVITAGGQTVPQGGGTGTTAPNFPDPNHYSDPNLYYTDSEAAVGAYVRQNYANNPTQAHQVEAATLAEVDKQRRAMAAHQAAALDTVQGTILDSNGGIKSLAQIPPSQLVGLSPTGLHTVQSWVQSNAKQITPDQQNTIEMLTGDAALNKEKFMNTDLAAQNLPQAAYTRFRKQQLAMQAGADHGVNDNPIITGAMNSVPGQNLLKSAGVPVTTAGVVDKTSPEYSRFYGAMEAEIEARTGPDGKPPAPKDVTNAMVQVAAKVGAHPATFNLGPIHLGGSEGTPAFAVPEADKLRITGLFQTHGIPTTEDAIARQYRYEQIQRSRRGK